uniref:Putative ovule protein n=1 Tax=Solanum chacoense TaxID=4108 RepID=A0A0V0H6H7_SOLCH
MSRPKNERDDTRLIPPRQVNLKLRYYKKNAETYNQLKKNPKTWLSRVQASKVLQLNQKKNTSLI